MFFLFFDPDRSIWVNRIVQLLFFKNAKGPWLLRFGLFGQFLQVGDKADHREDFFRYEPLEPVFLDHIGVFLFVFPQKFPFRFFMHPSKAISACMPLHQRGANHQIDIQNAPSPGRFPGGQGRFQEDTTEG